MIFNTNVICAYLDTRNNELVHPRGFSLQIPWNSCFFTRVVVRVIVGRFKELNKEINPFKKTNNNDPNNYPRQKIDISLVL